MKSASELHSRFAIDGIATISEIVPGYPAIEVDNQHAKATIALHGAQVLAYRPNGHAQLLWLSRDAIYSPGKAIRGGIPLCWPWFGPNEEASLPAHGFVRNRFWGLDELAQLADGSTSVTLGLRDDQQSLGKWSFPFKLQLQVIISQKLKLSLTMTNPGDTPCNISSALHAYFKVGDISRIQISGLEGLHYLDQLEANRRQIQAGAIRFNGELDRIYQRATSEVVIEDRQLARNIRINKSGSQSTVVWNPWVAKSGAMADFEPGGYRQMVCVETSNAAEDSIRLLPGSSHALGMSIAVDSH